MPKDMPTIKLHVISKMETDFIHRLFNPKADTIIHTRPTLLTRALEGDPGRMTHFTISLPSQSSYFG